METPGNFKFILILFFDCSGPVKSSFVQLLSYSFWGNRVLEMVIKLCCHFRSCILVILPNNPPKSPTVPMRQAFASFQRFASSEEVFPSFSNVVITFETVLLATPNNSMVFVTLTPAIRKPTIWPLLNSERSAILMNFD